MEECEISLANKVDLVRGKNVEGNSEKEKFWNLVYKKSQVILGETRDWVSNTSNISALLYHEMNSFEDKSWVNWVGLYRVNKNVQNQLILGPFQGKIACVKIAKGKGVCGTCWSRGTTVLVPNVHEFPGHIECDSVSESEIVLPIIVNNQVVAVLDIDSPVLNGLNNEDQKGLENIVSLLERGCDW
eukprot:TRINITY_DN15381_c0_g1_i1.p1 TRINITY_DN15381_c0_g1~~TRINITY_DN15381_c0_g1_i1.p1  ORF type:complete len:186 (-),score=36.21 TRINITY_DN15381_c0_g1_i1:16-573(-)